MLCVGEKNVVGIVKCSHATYNWIIFSFCNPSRIFLWGLRTIKLHQISAAKTFCCVRINQNKWKRQMSPWIEYCLCVTGVSFLTSITDWSKSVIVERSWSSYGMKSVAKTANELCDLMIALISYTSGMKGAHWVRFGFSSFSITIPLNRRRIKTVPEITGKLTTKVSLGKLITKNDLKKTFELMRDY